MTSGTAGLLPIEFQGQPCLDISLPAGDRVRIALHGAHVLSWLTADGQERLYLSPSALLDGVSAIRGGVPLCFPQFNQRVLAGHVLPKHGFARTQAWTLLDGESGDGFVQARLRLTSSPQTLALWPFEFEATLTVRLSPGCLRLGFEVGNTGQQVWPFALALHTYLQVGDISQTRLDGLAGLSYWDGVQNLEQPDVRQLQGDGSLRFSAETDRVYAAATQPLTVTHPGGRILLSQSASLADVVVWNPAAERCASINDMPADGWKHMLCVEAARINEPVTLPAGASWSGWQQLEVLAST